MASSEAHVAAESGSVNHSSVSLDVDKWDGDLCMRNGRWTRFTSRQILHGPPRNIPARWIECVRSGRREGTQRSVQVSKTGH